jgi:hypothetical protein
MRGHRQRRVENGGARLLAFVQRSGVLGRDGRISKNERSFYFADPGSLLHAQDPAISRVATLEIGPRKPDLGMAH